MTASNVRAECRLVWEPSPSVDVQGYRVYVSPNRPDIVDRTLPPVETPDTQVGCTTVSVDLDDYAGVSAYDNDGNESPLSNIVQRKDVVETKSLKVLHFIQSQEP